MKALKAFINPFEAPQRSVKLKIWVDFLSFPSMSPSIPIQVKNILALLYFWTRNIYLLKLIFWLVFFYSTNIYLKDLIIVKKDFHKSVKLSNSLKIFGLYCQFFPCVPSIPDHICHSSPYQLSQSIAMFWTVCRYYALFNLTFVMCSDTRYVLVTHVKYLQRSGFKWRYRLLASSST